MNSTSKPSQAEHKMYSACWQILTLFLVLVFCSCESINHALKFSVDANKQTYKIPQFPEKSPNETDFGINIAFLFAKPLNLGSPNQFIDEDLSPPTAASAFHDEYIMHWSPAYTKQAANTFYSPAASTEFVNNLFYLGGPELVLKRSKDGADKISLFYLEVPLHVVYKHTLQHGSLYGGLGPYLAYGLGGKIKSTILASDKINAFDKDLGFRRFDAGLSILAGYTFVNQLSVHVGYEWGMANITRDDYKGFNRNFSINVMYPIDKVLGK